MVLYCTYYFFNLFLMTMENFFSFTVMQYDIIAHTLTLGYAVMLAALFYFVMTMYQVLPKYRISSILSVVVMVSAFLILYEQANSWINNFYYDPALNLYVKNPDTLFTNGYRYLNWLIDVPTLLLQLTFVASVTAAVAWKARVGFVISGSLMILTGYIWQFSEMANDRTWYWVWFVVSCLFFLHVYYLLYQVISGAKDDKRIDAKGKKILSAIWYIFLFAWMLYPIAYLMPVILNTADGVVIRQILFTIADVTAKVFYGVLLSQLAVILSRAEGYDCNALKK